MQHLLLKNVCLNETCLTQNICGGERTGAGDSLEELDYDIHLVGDREGLERAHRAHQRAAQDQRALAAPPVTVRYSRETHCCQQRRRYLPLQSII